MRPARYFGAVAMQRHLDYITNLPENIQTNRKKNPHTTYKLKAKKMYSIFGIRNYIKKEIVVKNVIQFLF
jgi:hypothetical protein